MNRAEYLEIGERLTQALVDGDYALFRSIADLPFHTNPIHGTAYVLRTEAELLADFELYHRNAQLHHLRDIYRDVREITQSDSGVVSVSMRMELLSSSGRIVEPFVTVQHLHKIDDTWRIFRIDSSIGHINWTLGRATIGPDGSFTEIKQG